MSTIAATSCEHKKTTSGPSASRYRAQLFSSEQREEIATEAIIGWPSISHLARQHEVSRKFVYQQKARAEGAIHETFQRDEKQRDDGVLFYLPVTKAWLVMLVIVLVLCCHAPYRGIIEFFRVLLGQHISLGKIHNIMRNAGERAQAINAEQDQALLPSIDAAGLDELFEGKTPVLCGVDLQSSYCFLLEEVEHRDGSTWANRLRRLKAAGLKPHHSISDEGSGLCAGHAEGWSKVERWSDHFHVLYEIRKAARPLKSRASQAVKARDTLEQQMKQARNKGKGRSLSKKLGSARKAASQAIDLHTDVSILLGWLKDDVLSVHGPSLLLRREALDFIIDELKHLEGQCEHRIRPMRVRLENTKESILLFAEWLESELEKLALVHEMDVEEMRALFALTRPRDTEPWRRAQVALRHNLGEGRYRVLCEALDALEQDCIRASSMAENLNSRLRNYFFLRKQAGKQFLPLLRFFLNNQRFARSRRQPRVGKSPVELLSGKTQPHWLEQLGFSLFKRSEAAATN